MKRMLILALILCLTQSLWAQDYETLLGKRKAAIAVEKARYKFVVDRVIFEGYKHGWFGSEYLVFGHINCAMDGTWDMVYDRPRVYAHDFVYRKDFKRRICRICQRHEAVHWSDEYNTILQGKIDKMIREATVEHPAHIAK